MENILLVYEELGKKCRSEERANYIIGVSEKIAKLFAESLATYEEVDIIFECVKRRIVISDTTELSH